jgi:hypothetical protein
LIARINDLRKDNQAVSRVALGLVVAAIVLAAGVAAVLYMNPVSTPNNIAVGDFLKYETDVTMGDSHLVYVYWLNVTAVNSTGCGMQITTYLNDGLYSQSTPHLTKTGILNYFGTWPGRVDLGSMTIGTSFGSRDVEHYQYSTGGTTWDIYIGGNGVLYKYTTTIGSQTGVTELVASNISWI